MACKCLSREHRKAARDDHRDIFLELWMALPPSWLGAHLVSSCHLLSCTLLCSQGMPEPFASTTPAMILFLLAINHAAVLP